MTPLLVLLDVDGTLFLTDDPLAGRALRETLTERFDLELPEDAVERVDHRGQTALRIARLILDDDDVDLGGWCRDFGECYVELLASADTSGWRGAPREALERLAAAGHRLALLTGNPEPMARARMERLGLAGFFEQGQGAFGCDAESRVELIELARARAGGWPADETAEIGDTERDATSAQAAGVRSIRVGEAGLAGAVAELLAYT